MARPNYNVAPIRQVETINGVRIDLGRMSLEQLVELEGQCRERVVEAQTDLQMVQYVREGRERLGVGGTA